MVGCCWHFCVTRVPSQGFVAADVVIYIPMLVMFLALWKIRVSRNFDDLKTLFLVLFFQLDLNIVLVNNCLSPIPFLECCLSPIITTLKGQPCPVPSIFKDSNDISKKNDCKVKVPLHDTWAICSFFVLLNLIHGNICVLYRSEEIQEKLSPYILKLPVIKQFSTQYVGMKCSQPDQFSILASLLNPKCSVYGLGLGVIWPFHL